MPAKRTFRTSGMRAFVSAMLAGFVYLGFSALGLFMAFSDFNLDGGIPFIPNAWNQALGRALFGFGALVTGSTSIYFFVRALRRR